MALKRRRTSLIWIYLKQLFYFAGALLLEMMVIFVLFSLAMEKEWILPANYVENYLMEHQAAIASCEPFDPRLIPGTAQYGLYDQLVNYKSGNLTPSQQEEGRDYIQNGQKQKSRLAIIKRREGYCVVRYDLSAHFASPRLHQLCPRLELSLVQLFGICFVITLIGNACAFKRKLSRALLPLQVEIEKIQRQELTKTDANAKIKEFDQVLEAIYKMKDSLRESLMAKWQSEQMQKDHIAALAHDIKTPLTVIKGNAELILEEEDLEAIYHEATLINQYANQITGYLQELIGTIQTGTLPDQEEKIAVEQLVERVEEASNQLCDTHHIYLNVIKQDLHGFVTVNPKMIQRVMENIVSNAIEHSQIGQNIYLSFVGSHEKLIITVRDEGKGFSEEALHKATQQFYTEDKSRHGQHYGLGLHFASHIAQKYGGELICQNDKNLQGAIVNFSLKIDRL